MPVIEAVIFDYGGVLSTSPFTGSTEAEQRLGLPPGTIPRLLGFGLDVPEPEPGQPYTNAWHRLETGQIGLMEYGAWVTENARTILGPEQEFDLRRLGLSASLAMHWPVIHRIRRLRDDGYRLAICTNNIRDFASVWRAMVPLDLFDVVVDSSEEGVRKPDPRIYELTCERLGVEPPAALFCDDHPRNVAAARALGMRTVEFGSDVMAALEELDRVLASG